MGKRLIVAAVLGVLMLAGTVPAAPIYVATWESDSEVFVVDSATGSATSLGLAGTRISGLTMDAATLYGWGQNGSLYTVSRTTGAATLVGASGFSGIEGAIAWYAGDGMLYAADSSGGGNRLVRVDPTTGAGTAVGGFGAAGGDVSGLTFVGSTLYGVDAVQDNLVTVDITTGLATVVGPLGVSVGGAGTSNVAGLAYDGSTAYLVQWNGVSTVDLGTGAASGLSTFSANLVRRPIGGAAAMIPEGGTFVLVGLGLAGLALIVRRRRA